MKIKFDVTTQELAIIRQILKSILPAGSKVWVFGSRAKHQAKFNSDLDLAIEGERPLDKRTLMQLEMEFDEAPLPYSVDIVDMHKVDNNFRAIIDNQKVDFPIKPNVPELRFPGFTDSWVERKGDELFINSRAKGRTGLPIYSVTMNDGLVPRDSLERKMEDDAADELNLRAQPGDLVYNMMRMWQGAVGIAEVECMLSPAYIVLSPKPGTDTKFFLYSLKRPRALYDMWAYSYGLTEDRLRLYFKDFGRIVFLVPSDLEEQKKITKFLSCVDEKLHTLRCKSGLLKNYSRGLIQRILSQDIRFKKDSGADFPEWGKSQLVKIADRCLVKNTGGGTQRVLTNSATKGIIDQRDYFDKDIANSNNLNGYYLVEKGDYVYNPRISVSAPVGPINKNKIGKGLMSPLYSIFRFKSKDNTFYEKYFQSALWHRYMHSVANYGVRHDRMNITTSDFMAMPVPVPDPEEQQKIVDCLSSVDKKIESISKQIELLEKYKKGLLQKMFV